MVVPDSTSNRHVPVRLIGNSPRIPFQHGGYIAYRSVFTPSMQNKSPIYNNPRYYASKLVKEVGQPIEEKSHLFDADYVRNYIKELIIVENLGHVNTLIRNIENRLGQGVLSHDAVIDFFNF